MHKITTLAVAGLALAGLAACGDLDDRIAEEADASDIPVAGPILDAAERPAAEQPEVDPVVEQEASEGTSLEFVLAANDAGMTDDIDTMAGHFSAIAGYAERFDIDGAVNEARTAQALVQDMHTEALSLPGAGSETGVATIEAFDVCYWALDTTADAMGNFDVDGLETAVTEINGCTDALEAATATIPG